MLVHSCFARWQNLEWAETSDIRGPPGTQLPTLRFPKDPRSRGFARGPLAGACSQSVLNLHRVEL